MPERPNILLILTDQHRLSAVGCYGTTPCRTPNIDRLAAEGVRFETAYTACPVCSPARATLMTGLFPHAHGITSNVHNLGCNVSNLPDRPDLLSRRLQTAGYQLGYTGKWHLGEERTRHYSEPATPSLPATVGFEGQQFPGHGNGGFGYPEYQAWLAGRGLEHRLLDWDEPRPRIWPSGKLAGPVESTVPYFLADHTIGLIDRFRSASRPWFIWHNFWGPHGPYYVPGELVEAYRDVEIPPWPNFAFDSRGVHGPHHAKIHPFADRLTWDDWATAVRYYYAFTTLIDMQVGRMVEHLRASGELERTVIIFAADHGETLGSHGGMTDKGWHHWEETHRIPLIVRRPGETSPGRVERRIASLADIYPSLLELAGAASEAPAVHGRSLLPLLNGKTPADWPDFAVTEFGGVNSLAMTQRTLRWGDLKYGYNATGSHELYHLGHDPHEMRNLADEPTWAGRLADCQRKLFDWMKATGDGARGMFAHHACRHAPELTPATFDDMRARLA